MSGSKHSLRRNKGKTAFPQLSTDEVKSLITQWVQNTRDEIVRAELAEILIQLAGITGGGGADGVINGVSVSGNVITATRTIGANVTGAINLTGQTQVLALQNKVVTGIGFTGTDTKTLTVTFADATTLTANFSDISGGGGGGSTSTYNLLSDAVKVTGSAGITATLASGVYTIIVPASGVLTNFEVNVEVGDATYTNGLVSNSVKVKIDNSANNAAGNGTDAGLTFSPVFLARTAAGAINAGNPLQWSVAINTAIQCDEWAAGIRSWIFQQIPGNAAAGGVVTS